MYVKKNYCAFPKEVNPDSGLPVEKSALSRSALSGSFGISTVRGKGVTDSEHAAVGGQLKTLTTGRDDNRTGTGVAKRSTIAPILRNGR
jgi:hypothetical protein